MAEMKPKAVVCRDAFHSSFVVADQQRLPATTSYPSPAHVSSQSEEVVLSATRPETF
jgi:hypothetical protein